MRTRQKFVLLVPDLRITEKFCASGADGRTKPLLGEQRSPIARLEISYDANCPRLWPLQAKLPLSLNRTTNHTKVLVPHHPIPVSLSVKIEDRLVESMGGADAVAQSNEFARRSMEAVLGPPFERKVALLKPIPSTYQICQARESQRARIECTH